MAEEEQKQVCIEDLQLTLEIHQIQSEQKLRKLQQLFADKGRVDPNKMFYQDRSSLAIKFQNIISDLTEFLINQQVASTDKLRKTFYRLVENPIFMLFKVNRFDIFNLRLNAFDIQLDPIQAVAELGTSILANIKKQREVQSRLSSRYDGSGEYASFDQFLQEAHRKTIQDGLFLFYSYLRKGGNIIKKKFEQRVRVAELYNSIEQQVLKISIQEDDIKTLKELSTLNYEIYMMDNSYDVLCFFLKIPLQKRFQDIFKDLEGLGQKAKVQSNFNSFILIFLRYSKEILQKFKTQGIDEVYAPYIENILKSLLELWGCRLCYYQQFLDLFERLLSLHPKPDEALSICLKHQPSLSKEDVVLLRVNFKHGIQEKHADLLSLMRGKNMQEVNGSISGLYHQTLYNLDLQAYQRERIIELLTLLNNSNSLLELFGIVQRALKQWNHTIDFNHGHKFIQSEFKLPKIEKNKIEQSLRLVNNLCVLQEKNFKQYQELVRKGSIQKALLGLVMFLFQNQQGAQLIKQTKIGSTVLVSILRFLSKTTSPQSKDWQSLCLAFGKNLHTVPKEKLQLIVPLLRKGISERFADTTIVAIVKVYESILQVEASLQISSKATLESITDIFMHGTAVQNSQVAKFALFQLGSDSSRVLSKQQQEFLLKYGTVRNGVIQPKDKACFILSELELITNPVQFERIMDNYYFSLDGNAKRYVQYLANVWAHSINQTSTNKTSIALIQHLIQTYPIVLPLLCTTRIVLENVSKRFVEMLVDHISVESLSILKEILRCRSIRYKNGSNFIMQEITPLILKATIKLINAGSTHIEHYELLSESISQYKTADIKLDLIQKSLDNLNFELSQENSQQRAFRLSQASLFLVQKYFEKKQLQLRKNGLKNLAKQLVWNEIRIKQLNGQRQQKKVLQKANINEHIMITPFAISQQYNIDEYRLQNIVRKNVPQQTQTKPISQLIKNLPKLDDTSVKNNNQRSQTFKQIDLRGLKYNITSHLGQDLRQVCYKQGYRLLTSNSNEQLAIENVEQNITLVNFYLKSFQNPEVSSELILKYLVALLQNRISFCNLFANFANMHRLLAALFLLFRYTISQAQTQPATAGDSVIDKLIEMCRNNKQETQQKIITLLAEVGYTNIWAESYNSLATIQSLKQLRDRTKFKKEDDQQTFFSWVLKNTLENESLRQVLNHLLGRIFDTRPDDQNSLMYKVSINRQLLNSIMKSLQIAHLSDVALLFHSNFNNLRLYTDQLHEGLKALGMSSKNRSFNQFLQLSKDVDDEQFYGPMKLFKQNFAFFIRIEKEGYKFKRREEEKLGRQRAIKVLRGGASGDTLNRQLQQVIQQFEQELEKLQFNIASRVKSFYLATKLRDLSYQNCITVTLLNQLLSERKLQSKEILTKINQIQIFSLMTELFHQLVTFDSNHRFTQVDPYTVSKQVSLCTTKRFSHSISKIYQKCELQFDQVYQRCLDQLKMFLHTQVGAQWLQTINVYPPFLSQSFISSKQSQALISSTKAVINSHIKDGNKIQLSTDDKEFSVLSKSLRQLTKSQLLQRGQAIINFNGRKISLQEFLVPFKELLIKSETLSQTKDGYLLFNKYKSSEKTLQQLEILAIIVGYCVYNNIQIDLPLHASVLAAVGFGTCDLDDLVDVDFAVWQDLRHVLSVAQSKDLQLNFSYMFKSLSTMQPQRVQLVDKGTSKKVNNLNRQEYCDHVCCYLLYRTLKKQYERFLQALLFVCPKEILSSLSIQSLHNIFIKKHPNYSKEIIKKVMKKRGLVLPNSIEFKGKRIQNLKDYQTVYWLNEIMDENSKIKQSLWKNQTNIFVCTWMGQGAQFDRNSGVLLLGRFNSKQEQASGLSRL